ncbi:dihydropteroate synthase [Candidatus Roizmanbacteria bacterium]|nr:dihydropteroate synthase [Candidatus Roizmanbacteria bacterium]
MNTKKTQLMGILNVTPDSFSDGGEYFSSLKIAFARAEQMIKEGVDIIDVGGESTRPGAEKIEADEEVKRVLPVIKKIKQKYSSKILISIDTWKHEVALEATKAGCTIINSLGGFTFDPLLAEVAAKTKSQVMLYHIKGKPKTMQKGEIKYTDVIKEISEFFTEQIAVGVKYGIKKENLILDPGIGFGKTVEQNLAIIKRLKKFTTFNLPIAVGISRKSHLGKILENDLGIATSPLERLEACLAETGIAVQNGATFVRTHDVLPTKKFLTALNHLI